VANEMLKGGLDPACVKLELTATTRDAAIIELIGLIHAKHHLKNLEEATRAVMEREQKMSTSLENGLAVPHGKIASVDRLAGCGGIKEKRDRFQKCRWSVLHHYHFDSLFCVTVWPAYALSG